MCWGKETSIYLFIYLSIYLSIIHRLFLSYYLLFLYEFPYSCIYLSTCISYLFINLSFINSYILYIKQACPVYKCHLCGREYESRTGLNYHNTSHHTEVGVALHLSDMGTVRPQRKEKEKNIKGKIL